MLGLTKLKAWLVAAALGAGAILFLVIRIFNAGKASQESYDLKKGIEEQNDFDSAINAGHVAGNAARMQPVQHDPHDRANVRKNQS